MIRAAGSHPETCRFPDFLKGGMCLEAPLEQDLSRAFGLRPSGWQPVSGGWLNQKWRVETATGPVLVKRYSLERFPPPKLRQIRRALLRQQALWEQGFPCPRVYGCAQGPLRTLDPETVYMVMGFLPGRQETAASVSLPQLESLGKALGDLQRGLSLFPQEEPCRYPTGSAALRQALELHLESARRREGPPGFHREVEQTAALLDQVDLAFADSLPQGFSHEDFAPDNLLFSPESLAAVLDFDRNQWGYLAHDLGRALLAFAWTGQGLDQAKAAALLEGYRQAGGAAPAPADALRLTWCLEVPWWIQPEFFQDPSPKTLRFRQEIQWVTAQWDQLDILFP